MDRYNHERVQEYWQFEWDRRAVYTCPDDAPDPTYVLGMFPYTSGNLHMGHVRNYAITDAYARYRRMQGDDVLQPMGWDAFGLPAENAAEEHFTDPRSWTESCIESMREEMEDLGLGYDWSREFTTSDPEYYQWNQWLFERFYEAGLVEYDAAAVNWCPDCETVLADAQVERPADDGDSEGPARTQGVCWRCETPVETRELDQWFFTITDYAEELLDGLDDLEGWPESVREIQRNWIGKQEGVAVPFEVPDYGTIEAFTTRLDTIYGATYLAVSPGHDLATELAADDETVAEYVDAARGREGAESSDTQGVFTGVSAVHPVTGDEIPIYVAEYVLDDVGTGAVMGVPAHNERDHAFATARDIPIEQVVEPTDGTVDVTERAYTDEGTLVDSGAYDGLETKTAREQLLEDLADVESAVTYRLRDWLISRQRYWGTPIPVVHCPDCGPVLVPTEELPVELPDYEHSRANPLAANDAFVQTTCPECGGPAERETDTMDTFVDSAWYFLRFLSPNRDDVPFDAERANDCLPVDVYVGGEEHAVLHLLYIRFFTRVLADLDLLEVREPVDRLVNQGTVLHGGEKMSATAGNVITPHEYGPETTRLFVLEAAHPRQDFEWTAKDVSAAYDFQQRLYERGQEFDERTDVREERQPRDEYLDRVIDWTIAAATDEFDAFRFHQAIGEIQSLERVLGQYLDAGTPQEDVYRRALETLTLLLAPITPYLTEELWNTLRGGGLVVEADWPEPADDVEAYHIERTLIETTREDVRDICEVAGIDDPERIRLVVAPEWQYRAHERVRTADPETAVVSRALADELVAEHREAAGPYLAELEERRRSLEPVLPPDRERELLEQAGWLFAEEFDAAIAVEAAVDVDADLAARAEPGKPAIHIE